MKRECPYETHKGKTGNVLRMSVSDQMEPAAYFLIFSPQCLSSAYVLCFFVDNDAYGASSRCFTGWWFGTFFIFPYISNNHPNGLIFFRGIETTNQFNWYVLFPKWISSFSSCDGRNSSSNA